MKNKRNVKITYIYIYIYIYVKCLSTLMFEQLTKIDTSIKSYQQNYIFCIHLKIEDIVKLRVVNCVVLVFL